MNVNLTLSVRLTSYIQTKNIDTVSEQQEINRNIAEVQKKRKHFRAHSELMYI